MRQRDGLLAPIWAVTVWFASSCNLDDSRLDDLGCQSDEECPDGFFCGANGFCFEAPSLPDADTSDTSLDAGTDPGVDDRDAGGDTPIGPDVDPDAQDENQADADTTGDATETGDEPVIDNDDLGDASPPAVVAARQSEGLVAYYPADTGMGTVVADRSDNSPAAFLTINSDSVEWLAGRNGLVLFDAADVRSSASGAERIHQSVTGADAFTLEVWIRPLTLDQTGSILSFGADNGDLNVSLRQDETDLVVLLRTDNGGVDDQGLPPLVAQDALQARATQVVVTFVADGDLTLYVDGAVERVESRAGGLSNWQDDFELTLGSNAAGADDWLGVFMLGALYDRAASEADVLQNFMAGSNPTLAGLPLDSRAPAAPAQVLLSGDVGDDVRIGWEAADDDVAVVGYEVFGDDFLRTTTVLTGFQAPTSSASSYAIRAYDAAGNRSESSPSLTVGAP